MLKISSLASNALLTKSRAMNAAALTADDYAFLASCHSLHDVVNYLKANTVYEKAVDVLLGSKLYRSRIEAEIKRFNNRRVADLASFESAIGQKLHEIVFLEYDVRLILSCADHLDTNEVSDFSLFTPESYFKHSALKPELLEMAMSLEEFYSALDGTPYQKALDIFRVGKTDFTITGLENALYQYIYSQITRLVKKNYSGSDEKEILDLLKAKSDFKMLESIYRMKKYFPNEALNFNNVFYSGFSAFSQKEITAMLECDGLEKLLEMFSASVYGKYFLSDGSKPIEYRTRLALLKLYSKRLRFSTVPEVTMFSFIGILENETTNLINIIEGVRYELPAESILDFIVTL